MEQSIGNGENTEYKAVSPVADQKSSVKDAVPTPGPNPDPTPAAGANGDALKQGDTANIIDVYVNEESNKGAKESNDDSKYAGRLKSKKSVTWSQELVMEKSIPRDYDHGSHNPYDNHSPASSSANLKNTMTTVKNVLGRWGKKVGETTRKAEDLAGNTWQHLKTSPSLADAALGRIAQGTKVIAEGGYEKVFRQTFETGPEEQLQNTYACYLSTSAGPVMGVLYVSTAKLGFCSDSPLSYKAGDKTEWSYYKVVIPLHQLKAVNPSTSRSKPAGKYIQVISVDNHEFWCMGFLNYNGAVKCLQDALRTNNSPSV